MYNQKPIPFQSLPSTDHLPYNWLDKLTHSAAEVARNLIEDEVGFPRECKYYARILPEAMRKDALLAIVYTTTSYTLHAEGHEEIKDFLKEGVAKGCWTLHTQTGRAAGKLGDSVYIRFRKEALQAVADRFTVGVDYRVEGGPSSPGWRYFIFTSPRKMLRAYKDVCDGVITVEKGERPGTLVYRVNDSSSSDRDTMDYLINKDQIETGTENPMVEFLESLSKVPHKCLGSVAGELFPGVPQEVFDHRLYSVAAEKRIEGEYQKSVMEYNNALGKLREARTKHKAMVRNGGTETVLDSMGKSLRKNMVFNRARLICAQYDANMLEPLNSKRTGGVLHESLDRAYSAIREVADLFAREVVKFK